MGDGFEVDPNDLTTMAQVTLSSADNLSAGWGRFLGSSVPPTRRLRQLGGGD